MKSTCTGTLNFPTLVIARKRKSTLTPRARSLRLGEGFRVAELEDIYPEREPLKLITALNEIELTTTCIVEQSSSPRRHIIRHNGILVIMGYFPYENNRADRVRYSEGR